MKCQGFHMHWVKIVVLNMAWHIHRYFLLFMHLVHTSGLLRCWFHKCLSLWTLAYCLEMVQLTTCAAHLTKCQALSMHLCCTTVFTFPTFNYLFHSPGCCLPAVFVCLYFYTWSKSCMHFISSSTFFCTIYASIFGAHISTCSLSISHMFLHHQFFYYFLKNFFIVYTTNKLFLEPSIMFFVITFWCFYTESNQALPCQFIPFSLQFTVL